MEKWMVCLLVLAATALYYFIRWLPVRPRGSRVEQTGRATVISKRVKQNNGSYGALSRWDYMVTFELGSVQLELYVTQSGFRELKEGTTGQLVWQYENLISFEADGAE